MVDLLQSEVDFPEMKAPPRALKPADSPQASRVVVVGTLNVDLVCRVPGLPQPGRTILADSVVREFGGKGANQAVAAARQHALVVMVGAVGYDADGRSYCEHLAHEGVAIEHIARLSGAPTGTAHVYVDPRGENSIVVNRGANALLDAALVRRSIAGFLTAHDVVLVQLETSLGAAVEALRVAAQSGARAIFNASPVVAGFPWAEVAIDTVIVNEHECEEWFGHAPRALWELAPARRQDFLRQRHICNVVITQGSEPTLWLAADARESVPTHPVVPRDTVGAGDTVAGVLAAQLAAGVSWREALWHANVAAALSTLEVGAQTAMPTYEQVRRIADRATAKVGT